MNMQKRRFAVGIFAGLLLALAIVLSASYVPGTSGALANLAPGPAGAAQTTTVVFQTMTSTESVTIPPTLLYTASGSTSGLSSGTTSMTTTGAAASATSAAIQSTATETTTTATMPPTSTVPAATSSTEAITTRVVTTTISSTETLSPGSVENTYGSDTGSRSAAVTGPAASPSSVSKIIGAPIQSVVFLLPVLIAVFLGLVFYKASAVRE